MKENSFTFSIILFTTIVFIYSCSTEEDSNSLTAATPSLTPLEINTTDVTNDPEIFNYDIYADYKEKTVDFYPFAFFASDLSQNVINGISG